MEHTLLLTLSVLQLNVILFRPIPLSLRCLLLERRVVFALIVVVFFRLQLCFLQLLQHGVGDGQHHGRRGGVADPHGQERRDDHESHQ